MKKEHLSGILMAVCALSWFKLFYWHFDDFGPYIFWYWMFATILIIPILIIENIDNL